MQEQELQKSHVKGYTKKDGQYVKPHERAGEASHPEAHHHPQLGEKGQQVLISRPHHASSATTWHNGDSVATFVPHGDVPLSLNGVKMMPWRDAPKTPEGWNYAEGINRKIIEPKMQAPMGKHVAAGVIIEEPDGRVWLIAPTNQYGGYEASFPKGTAEEGLSLQANALKEAWEESGLKVQITDFLGDFERTTSVCRMYKAKRIGGDPTMCGWETQAVHLVPKGHLYEHLNMWPDHPIAEAIGGGPAPKKPVDAEKAKPNDGAFNKLFGKYGQKKT